MQTVHLVGTIIYFTVLVCLSCLDLKTPARIHFAARRIKTKAPHAKLMLGLWTATDDAVLATLKDAVNAPMQIDCALSASVLGKALCESGIGAAAIAKQLKLVCGLEGQ